MKTMFNFFITVFLLFCASFGGLAQTYSSFTTAANTPLLVSDGRDTVQSITAINATAGPLNLKVYDSANTTTNYTRQAYNAVISYPTNYAVITTNSSGRLITNNVIGNFRNVTAVSTGTVVKPKLLDMTIPANTIRVFELDVTPAFGLLAHTDGVIALELLKP